jgi:hypothetical protein
VSEHAQRGLADRRVPAIERGEIADDPDWCLPESGEAEEYEERE